MVKMTETIICQRFIQNAWKKDLCSNCFKSKEDHVVLPEKKITYRWTSHVNNFPQHGILKDREKNGMPKLRTVSFHTTEMEVIGFGGEEYSSDDEIYPSFGDECAMNDTDNEEEVKEFRKLTQSNTDFNSIPANLKSDKPVDAQPRNTYSNLKLGKPLTDADGRRQTLKVTVEPFCNSVIVNGTLANDRKVHLNKILLDPCPNHEKTDDDEDTTDIVNNNCDTQKCSKEDFILDEQYPIVCDGSASKTNQDSAGILNVSLTEATNVNSKCGDTESKTEIKNDEDAKYVRVSNVLVNAPRAEEKKVLENGSQIAENIKNAKSMLEPLFRLSSTMREDGDKPKLSIYQSGEPNGVGVDDEKQRACSISKDCSPITLALITSKDLDIELDKPGSREMVGEPDGKADSDDSSDPLVLADQTETESAKSTTPTESTAHANPQRSFLHAFSKEKPKLAIKPAALVAAECTPKKTTIKDLPEIMNSIPSTPKMQISLSTCHGTGSTKRQAPKPPSTKSSPTSLTAPMLVQRIQTPAGCSVTDNVVCPSSTTGKCESPLVNGSRDAVSFLGENGPSGVKRRLHLESTPVVPLNRNSLNFVSVTPNGTDSLKRYMTMNGSNDYESRGKDADTISITSTETTNSTRSAIKCSRSLSCDSIMTPNGHTLPLSEKTRKYAGATIKVKSTIRKFLRFSNKDDDKRDDLPIPAAPRRRIEIIHPLDLNKSSIEILRSTPLNEATSKEDALKQIEIECSGTGNTSPKTPPINYATCPAGRPNKPPPPPRTQSLDQKLVSEISKPVRPPPPKSVQPKPQLTSKFASAQVTSNLYENLGESRQGIAPAKPQRASSMRDRARQITVVKNEENLTTLVSDSEAVPECDRNRQQQQITGMCERQSAPSTIYCGSETESDFCYQSVTSSGTVSSTSELSDVILLESETRKNKSVVYSSLEDNYGAVVVANHEALSQLLEQVNQATLVPNSLKTLQTTLHIRFDHFTIDETSKIAVADWNFYNAKWNNQNVVLSLSNKHLGPMKSLPTWITLYPLVKFTDIIPSRYLKDVETNGESNAYITVWNEERIESVQTYCRTHENTTTFSESGLLLTQLTNALKHLQACGIEDISLDEIFICKRESDIESKLVLLPINVDCISSLEPKDRQRMSLCKCVSAVLNMLLPNQKITDIIRQILSDERAASLSQAKAVAEYWLWGPYNVALSSDRQTSLQRWLDLERATYLHKVVCKKPDELSLNERCHTMFLVRTNAKTLTEASYLLEKQTL